MVEFNWINNCITFVRLLLFSHWGRKKIKADSSLSEVYILANGPSLNKELEILSEDFFVGKDNLVVNYFVFSEVYEKICPKHYVISAPDIFYDDPAPGFVENNKRLFKGLETKTNWQMTLYVPYLAKKYKNWQKKLTNKNIHIHYYNTAVAEGSFSIVKMMLNSQMGLPRVQNVLIPSLAFMFYKGYKEIYLFGVDHSWLKQIHVTNENEVLMSHPHFYEKEVKTTKVTKGVDDSRKLHEVLHKFYHTFKSYFVLNQYAKKKGVKVYNLTEGSYIDAFDRLDINKLKSNES